MKLSVKPSPMKAISAKAMLNFDTSQQLSLLMSIASHVAKVSWDSQRTIFIFILWDESCRSPEALYRVTEDNKSDSSSSQDMSIRKYETPEPTTDLSDSPHTLKKFQDLPPELRLMVWKYYPKSQPTRYVQIEWRRWQNGFNSRTAVPVFLQINRELRHEAQKQWPLTFASTRFAPNIRVNNSIDVLYLTNSLDRKAIDRLILRRLFDQVPQEELTNIKKIYFSL